jgi:hypothetical protein
MAVIMTIKDFWDVVSSVVDKLRRFRRIWFLYHQIQYVSGDKGKKFLKYARTLHCSFRALYITNSQHPEQQNAQYCSQIFILHHIKYSYMFRSLYTKRNCLDLFHYFISCLMYTNVANLVLYGIASFGSLMVIPWESKHVGIFRVILQYK